jgi:hypothetical protein
MALVITVAIVMLVRTQNQNTIGGASWVLICPITSGYSYICLFGDFWELFNVNYDHAK